MFPLFRDRSPVLVVTMETPYNTLYFHGRSKPIASGQSEGANIIQRDDSNTSVAVLTHVKVLLSRPVSHLVTASIRCWITTHVGTSFGWVG